MNETTVPQALIELYDALFDGCMGYLMDNSCSECAHSVRWYDADERQWPFDECDLCDPPDDEPWTCRAFAEPVEPDPWLEGE